jgi:hypothetical protein
VSAWPQQLQQQLVQPAVAAAARGKGLMLTQQQQQQQHSGLPDAGSSSSSSSVQPQGLPAPVSVPADAQLLEQLRQRLWSMVAMEAEMCDDGSSSSRGSSITGRDGDVAEVAL